MVRAIFHLGGSVTGGPPSVLANQAPNPLGSVCTWKSRISPGSFATHSARFGESIQSFNVFGSSKWMMTTHGSPAPAGE